MDDGSDAGALVNNLGYAAACPPRRGDSSKGNATGGEGVVT
jgi:hypothetical protein